MNVATTTTSTADTKDASSSSTSQRQQQHFLKALLSPEPCTPSNPWLIELLLAPSSPTSKQQQRLLLLQQVILKLSRSQISTLFTSLHRLVFDYVVAANQQDDDNDDDEANENNDLDALRVVVSPIKNDSDENKGDSALLQLFGVKLLHAAAVVVQAHLDGQLISAAASTTNTTKKGPLKLMEEVYDLATLLHDQLFYLQQLQQQQQQQDDDDNDEDDDEEDTYHDHDRVSAATTTIKQNRRRRRLPTLVNLAHRAHEAILHLCETCWQAPVVDRAPLIIQVLPILLTLSLSSSSTPSTRTTSTKRSSNATTASTTASSSNKTLLQRIWQIRHALNDIDFQDESTTYLRSILLKTATHPLWLKLPEGRRFLAFLFSSSLDDDVDGRNDDDPKVKAADAIDNDEVEDAIANGTTSFKKELHQAIFIQLSQASSTILQAYADIYFRAWKESVSANDEDDDNTPKKPSYRRSDEDDDSNDEDNIRRLSRQQWLEQHVLQDLVYAMVHAKLPALHNALHAVLEPFYAAHKTPAVAALWYRLCSPILWRSLAAPHPQIRYQAMSVLAKVFPLVDATPSTTTTSTPAASAKAAANVKAAMDKALQTMDDMLLDPYPVVRVATSLAVAQVLTMFWDVVPTKAIRSLLNQLVMKHGSDASSALVRAGALQAITILLQAPESHAVLRTLLPLLGNLIHDRAARVRLAAVKMLMGVQQWAPTIKFYHVVPVHHLTARLAEEPAGSPVASALTLLLVPSYLPTTLGGANQVQRTLVFLARDPMAAAIFYANVAHHVPVSTVTKLIAMLWRCLAGAVEAAEQDDDDQEASMADDNSVTPGQQQQQQRSSRDGQESVHSEQASQEVDDSVNQAAPRTMLTASNRPLMANMAETIDTLWSSIEVALTKANYQRCREFLVESFSGTTLTSVLEYFEAQDTGSDSNGDGNTTGEERNDDGDNSGCCYRVCSALLRCAARLPKSSIPCLLPHMVSYLETIFNKITTVLSSLDDHCHDRVFDHVVSYFALLCAWGYTEQVAKSLSLSLQVVLNSGDDDDIESFPSLPKSKKRGRRGSGMVNQDATAMELDNGDKVTLPVIDALAALRLLDNILRGANTSSQSVRSLFLASPSATETLEQVLKRSMKCAEQLMKAEVNSGFQVDESTILLIVLACNAYGRLALHKEAATDLAACIRLNQSARTLLEWTADRVVPALNWTLTRLTGTNLMEGDVAPFPDLDLSRISTLSSSVCYMTSPSPQPPPRQRANRNFTPHRLEASFESYGGDTTRHRKSGTLLTESSLVTANAVAVTLFLSSCSLFAVWLTLVDDGSETNHEMEDICTCASKWFDSLFTPPSVVASPPAGSMLQPDVWAGLLKMAVHLGKEAKHLKPFELCIKNGHVELEKREIADVTKTCISLLLSSRGDVTVVANTVDVVVKVMMELLDDEQPSEIKNDELPLTIPDFWHSSNKGGCISVALAAISSNKEACLMLAERLVSIIKAESSNKSHAVFATQCLLWLWNPQSSAQTSHSTKAKIASMLRDANVVHHHLVDGIAVDSNVMLPSDNRDLLGDSPIVSN